MTDGARRATKETARRLTRAVETVRSTEVVPARNGTRRTSPSNGWRVPHFIRSFLDEDDPCPRSPSAAFASQGPDPRILRDVAEVRRLISYVYRFPYPILDRDRVYRSVARARVLLASGDLRRASEELEELRGYLLTHLIIAEAALMEDEPRSLRDEEWAPLLDV